MLVNGINHQNLPENFSSVNSLQATWCFFCDFGPGVDGQQIWGNQFALGSRPQNVFLSSRRLNLESKYVNFLRGSWVSNNWNSRHQMVATQFFCCFHPERAYASEEWLNHQLGYFDPRLLGWIFFGCKPRRTCPTLNLWLLFRSQDPKHCLGRVLHAQSACPHKNQNAFHDMSV